MATKTKTLYLYSGPTSGSLKTTQKLTSESTRDYLNGLGISLPVPDFSTISRRMRRLGALAAKAEGGDWAVDATGIGSSGVGEYRGEVPTHRQVW